MFLVQMTPIVLKWIYIKIKLDGVFVQKNGVDIKAVVEFDFWGGNGHMRLRKAFVETGHWQIGQN